MSAPSISYIDHVRATIALAWPVIAGQLGHIIIGQVDNLMIGQLGATELAACALANRLFFESRKLRNLKQKAAVCCERAASCGSGCGWSRR